MKRNWRNSWIVIALAALLTLASCAGNGDHAGHNDTYTCPMHPTVVSDRPATCPVCGMDLVRKARPGEEVEITEDLARLIESPNEVVVGNIRTIKATYKPQPVSVEAKGLVTYDTRNIHTIASRIGGRLEKVYLKYAFQPVKKGQPVAEIYSPELITSQRELLFLRKNDPDNAVLIDGAKRKLELLGMTPAQIGRLIERSETTDRFTVYSPYSGYLITGENTQAASPGVSANSATASDGMGNGMGGGMGTSLPRAAGTSNATAGSESGTVIREGSYVSAGSPMFTVVNTDALRIELDLTAAQGASLQRGDSISLDYGAGRKEKTTIDLVQPFFNEGQDFVKIRVITNRTEALHIGELVSATIQLPARESLWVPREAILDLGTERIVFIKERGVLKPKQVTTGMKVNGEIEITGGLASSDEIAANAQYLIDSENFVKTDE